MIIKYLLKATFSGYAAFLFGIHLLQAFSIAVIRNGGKTGCHDRKGRNSGNAELFGTAHKKLLRDCLKNSHFFLLLYCAKKIICDFR